MIKAIEDAERMQRLLHNDDFTEMIFRKFIDDGIRDFTLDDDVRSEGVQDELVARKILYRYIYDIINRAEILKKEQIDE